LSQITEVNPPSGKQIVTINPATEEQIQTYSPMNKDQVERLVDKAKRVFPVWKKDYDQRRGYVYNLVTYLKKNKERLGKVATLEMGKSLKEAISEVEKCAWALEFYADHTSNFLHEEILSTDARKSFVSFDPLGVIGSIMPWNFPYWQGLRFAAPCLMSGNTIIMKPSRVTIQCGLEIEKAFLDSGFPEGIFQTLVGSVESANHLIDSDVNAVTFTGSTNAGAKVGQRAAANLKKCVLELGGSDPFIVLDDSDIDKAAQGAANGRFINCGQSCIASKRFFVGKNVSDDFIEKFIQITSKLKVGDPMSMETDIGPLSNKEGLETISGIVEDAKQKGAEILIGGSEKDGKGYFYEPTILINVKSNMRIAKEETFGPVAPVTIVEDEREAVKLANDIEFGLGASIWTKDLAKAEKMSKRIEAGIVSVNNVVVSDPRIPFGGIKHSGYGRELSKYGLLEFVNIKSVRFYDNLAHHHYVE
jgi:succinate-semialdehyde dehydrogenase/glutarate-semialdehyde dehydrogenase/succinyl-CoA reductase